MKKVLLLLACLFLLVALAGCGGSGSDVSADDFSKAQAVAVTTPDGRVLETITDQAAIEALVTAMDVDAWELADLPEDAKTVGEFGLSQQKTVHFGETVSDPTLYDVGEIIVYDVPYLSATLLGFDFTFAIPEAAHDALLDYFAE